MTKLILGCGYLGTRVARRWLDEGCRVYATTRTPARAAVLQGLGVEPIVCDVLQPESLAALPAADTLLYCISLDRSVGQTMRAVYVDGLANVLAALQNNSRLPKRLIYVSSTSVYGQSDDEWVDESSPTEPTSESGRIVLQAERLLSGDRKGAVILRFAGIYGLGRLLRYDALKAGQPIAGPADKWLNLIHVDDGVSAVLASEKLANLGGVYNVCDSEPVRRSEFFEYLAELLRVPAPKFQGSSTEAAVATHSSRGQANRRVRNHKMLSELGFQLRYPSYRVGLAQALVDGGRRL